MLVSTKKQQILERLRKVSVDMHEPSFHPDNIEPERLEQICSELRVSDPHAIMLYDMTHRCEV